MNSKTLDTFWACFDRLPPSLQAIAREKYRLWSEDPFHPSLQFKEVSPDLWSVRISVQYRALARRRGDLVVWFWIGPHAQYDRLIKG